MKGYTGFDIPVIQQFLGVDLEKEFKCHDLITDCWMHKLYGGQKSVEKQLGFYRDQEEHDGGWAGEVWKQYLIDGDKTKLQEMLKYNRLDVMMCRAISNKISLARFIT